MMIHIHRAAPTKRPDYATIVHGNLIRQTYKNVRIIIAVSR